VSELEKDNTKASPLHANLLLLELNTTTTTTTTTTMTVIHRPYQSLEMLSSRRLLASSSRVIYKRHLAVAAHTTGDSVVSPVVKDHAQSSGD